MRYKYGVKRKCMEINRHGICTDTSEGVSKQCLNSKAGQRGRTGQTHAEKISDFEFT